MSQNESVSREVLDWENREPKTAILVLGCLETVYDQCIQTIRRTWGASSVDGTDIFYVYGAQNEGADAELVDIEKLIGRARPQLQDYEAWVSGDIILCGAADVYSGQPDCILRKRLIAFDYLTQQQRYDYIYTVCAGSYVDVEALQAYVRSIPAKGIYHGSLGVYEPGGSPFVSGASLLMSKDVAEDLARNKIKIISTNYDLAPDDVVIGRWVAVNHCAESTAEICARIGAGERATDNQTFVLPLGRSMEDFVWAPVHSQVPQDRVYHYHFHSARMWEMDDFHSRFFARQLLDRAD